MHDINTGLVNSTNSNLKSGIKYDYRKDDTFFNISANVYEDLNETSNKRYEYLLPNINFGKSLFSSADLGTLNFKTKAYYTNYEVNKNTPVGLRINFAVNTFELIKISPIFGIGTGDFPDEYKKINQIKSPEAHITSQPHNMYLLIFAQVGVLGLTVFLWFFLIQL